MLTIINLTRDEGKEYFIPVIKSTLKELSPIELLIMIYLYRYRSVYGDLVLISINSLVSSCGYNPNGRKVRDGHSEGISVKFRNTLSKFIKDSLLCVDDDLDIDKVKASDLFYIQLNMEKINYFSNIAYDQLDDKGKLDHNFVMIEFSTMDKIITSGVKDTAGFLFFYLYIKQFINISEGSDYKHYALVTNDKIKDNVIISNDKLYSPFEDKLQELGLLYKHNFGFREVDGIPAQVPNAYVLDTRYFNEASSEVKKLYKIKKFIPYNSQCITSKQSVDTKNNNININRIRDKKQSNDDETKKEKSSIIPFNNKAEVDSYDRMNKSISNKITKEDLINEDVQQDDDKLPWKTEDDDNSFWGSNSPFDGNKDEFDNMGDELFG